MSASSQAAGNNIIRHDFSPVSDQISMCSWVMVNAWDKDTYGVWMAIENSAAGTGYREVAFQQDTDGPGTADLMQGIWWNGTGSGTYGSTATVTTASGVWLFLALRINGTSVKFTWGLTSGGLTTETKTADYNVGAAVTRCAIGGDNVNEYANGSFRAVKVWTAELSDAELLAERDSPSPTYSPVRAADLVAFLPCVDGATATTATVGTNWTLVGAFADGATDPVINPPSSNEDNALFFGSEF